MNSDCMVWDAFTDIEDSEEETSPTQRVTTRSQFITTDDEDGV